MDLIQQITLSTIPGVIELPPLDEALLRLGFVPLPVSGVTPITILTVGSASFVAAGLRSPVIPDLIGSMYEVKVSFRQTSARFKP